MPSIDVQYLETLKTHIKTSAKTRQAIIAESNEILFLSKRTIFALHRGTVDEAKQKCAEAGKRLSDLVKKFKSYAVLDEGSYRAAAEEYVEASLFLAFCSGKKMRKVAGPLDEQIYLAGLCDVPGELQRYAISAATKGDEKTVERCVAVAQELYGSLIDFEFTQYLRTKFDQAKQAVMKLEQIGYEVALRAKHHS